MLNHKKYWSNFSYNLKGQILGNDSLTIALSRFWSEIVDTSTSSDSQLVYFMMKVQFDDGSIRSLSYLQKVTRLQYEYLLESLCHDLDARAEDYSQRVYINLIFSYHIMDLTRSISITSKITKPKSLISKFTFGEYILPVTTDYSKWASFGYLVSKTLNSYTATKINSLYTLTYDITVGYSFADIKSFLNGKEKYTFKDIFGLSHDSFTRVFNNKSYIFELGRLIYKTIDRKVKFIKKLAIHLLKIS